MKVNVILNGPSTEVIIPREAETDASKEMEQEVIRIAQEAVKKEHEELDQERKAKGPDYWDCWLIEVFDKEGGLLYQEQMPLLLEEMGY